MWVLRYLKIFAKQGMIKKLPFLGKRAEKNQQNWRHLSKKGGVTILYVTNAPEGLRSALNRQISPLRYFFFNFCERCVKLSDMIPEEI